MPETSHIDAKSGDVLLLVGTMKGAFLLSSNADRKDWTVGGPYFPGRAIYALHHDQRNGRNRLWAAVNSSFWGSYLSTSDSLGREWTEPEAYNIKFPEDSDTALKQIWQLEEGHADEPDTLFCGVEPAALFDRRRLPDRRRRPELERPQRRSARAVSAAGASLS
jgi:hypothetical protein